MATPLEVFLQGRDDTRTAFRSLSTNLDRIRAGTAGLIARWRDLTIVAGGVVRVVRSVTNAVGETLRAAERQVNAEVKLGAALRNTEGSIRDNVDALKDFASERQRTTTFGDELSLELATIGATFGLTVDQIQKSIVAVQDQALAVGRSPIELMRQVARFGAGVTDSLQELGIVVDKDADRVTEFNRVMAQMTTGMSEAIGAMPTSALAQLDNTLGDVRESLGKVIASTGTFQTILREVEEFASRLNEALDNREVLEEVTSAIDGFVVDVLEGFNTVAGGALRMAASIIDAVAVVVNALDSLPFVQGPEEVAAQMGKVRAELNLTSEAADPERYSDLVRQLGVLEVQSERMAGVTELSGEALRDAADALDDWTRGATDSISTGRTWIDAQEDVFDLLEKTRGSLVAMPDAWDDQTEAMERAEEAAAQLQERLAEFEAIGAPFSFGIQQSIADAFDEDVGAEQAMKNLGERMKFALIDQFSASALAPITATLGQVAGAFSAPFEAVGNVVDDVLRFVINKFAVLLGLQELTAAAGLKGAAVATAQAGVLGGAWGGAAVAASIATLGGALSAIPGALAGITAGATLTKALSIPAFAEGGVVQPQPGGTLARIAEAGRPEAVIPLQPGMDVGAVRRIGEVLSSIPAAPRMTEQIQLPIQGFPPLVPLQDGGIVQPRPGGVPALLAEAGVPEAVIPLGPGGAPPRGFEGGLGESVTVHQHITIHGSADARTVAILGDETAWRLRRLRPRRGLGALL